MKKIYHILSFAFALLLATSCEESLSEFNVDPNNPTAVELNLQLPEVLTQSAFNEGTNPNRVAGIIMQQFVGIDAQQLAYNDYLLPSSVMNNYWNTGLYSGVLRSCDVLINSSSERPFYGAVAKIVMANELGKATAMFGDLPYSEAFQGTDNLKPAYDSQESIYNTVQQLLDEAIAHFNENPLTRNDGGYNGGDLMYDLGPGNEEQIAQGVLWQKLAYGLKARYYMHTSKRNSGDLNLALQAAENSFASNQEAGGFTFGSAETANWALAKFGIERPSTLAVDDRFAASLDGDPRQALLTEFDGAQWTFFNGAAGSLIWGRSDATIPMMSFVEVQFIKAEALGTVAALQDAVSASMELTGVDGSDYVANISSASLEDVMNEAYKAYFGFNFHETWANWRRTGFPSLSPSEGCGDNGFNPSCAIPARYIYAESERQTNSAAVEAAAASQGGDLLDVKLWAFE